jgi:hypothetical protein
MMITPSFALDFTTATLDSRVAFSRSGNTATIINSSGAIQLVNEDLPRFDYNPATLVCRGLLVEGTRTNLLPYSNPNAGVPTGYTVGFSTGTFTHTLEAGTGLLSNFNVIRHTQSTSGRSYLNYAVTLSANTTYVLSMYIDLAQTDNNNPILGVANFSDAVFPSGSSRRRSDADSNGKITLIFTTGLDTTGDVRFGLGPTGNATGTVVFGEWQLEAGDFATSYIPTEATAVTRNADVATITGTNFSDWWQASKGGVLVRARPGTVSGIRPWLQFDDGTANEIIALRGNTTNPELYIVDDGAPQAQIDAGTIAANTDYSMTAWWATNDCKARLDSGAVVTDTTATIPTVTQARLGSDGTSYLNGHLASISYYDTFSDQIYTRRKNKVIFNLL